jgi:hypothetical protein
MTSHGQKHPDKYYDHRHDRPNHERVWCDVHKDYVDIDTKNGPRECPKCHCDI